MTINKIKQLVGFKITKLNFLRVMKEVCNILLKNKTLLISKKTDITEREKL